MANTGLWAGEWSALGKSRIKIRKLRGEIKARPEPPPAPQAALRVLTELVTQYSVSRCIRIRSSTCDSMIDPYKVPPVWSSKVHDQLAYYPGAWTRNKGYIQCADGPGDSLVRGTEL